MFYYWKKFVPIVASFTILAVASLNAFAIGSTPVTVVNPDNASVPIHDAGQPQPVDGTCVVFGSNSFTLSCALFTVPAGKRLVVETFSYFLNTFSGDATQIIFGDFAVINCIGCGHIYFLPPVFAGTQGSVNRFMDTRQTRVYLDENKTFGAQVEFDTSNNSFHEFTFSGFLVNK